MFDKIAGKTAFLEKALNASWMRNEVLTNNIANANTPNFKRQDVSFDEVLSNIEGPAIPMRETGSGNKKFLPVNERAIMASMEPKIVQDKTTRTRKDGNNIDEDVEMAELSKNTIKFNGLIQIISGEYNKLKSAISGGR